MGCCHSANIVKEEEEEEEQTAEPIDIRFSATSADETERNTRSTVRHSQPRTSTDLGGPINFAGRYGSTRGGPSPSLSSVSLVPVARTGSYDVRVASRTRQNGGDGVIETSRLVVDHLKGNVFINQYLIIKDLGKGAHGTVKLVYNTQDDMLYAMKVIHKRRMRRQSYLAEPRAVANLMRNVGMSPLSQSQTEGRGPSPLSSPRTPNGMTDEYSNEIAVMKELDHPNVVKLYEVIHDPSNNKLLMTMEYVEGGCVLAGNSPTQKVPIMEATAVKYFRDVVKGLEYLHFNRIVHGDLKPDNLLMSSSGKVKISDFGSARFCEKSDMIFATAGTPSFMAPEMCQGKQFNGFPGDIWALGVCLFMFVFGRPPFTGNTTYQIYEAIQRGDLVSPPEIPVSPELKDLLTRLLQKDPAQRISLEDIPAHPWVTRGGSLPVLQTSNERAVQRVFEAMRKRNESGAKRPAPSTVPLAAPPEPVDMRKLIPDAEVRHYRDGEVIIAQGQLPEGLYYVQEGFVDMMLMPSERKLVADEDFADAIDDEEDEEDEAMVTATANALDCRRSPGSGEGGEAEGGSGGEDGGGDVEGVPEEGEEGAEVPDKGMDGFMALFGARLSDRVSPLGSSPAVTPRNQSALMTPRHGSQTIVPRNSSTTIAPRYGSQTLVMNRNSNVQHDAPARANTQTAASASMPLPPALYAHNSTPVPSNHLHHHSPLPQHLTHLTAAGGASSRSPSQLPSRTGSQACSTPVINSPTGTTNTNNSNFLTPRHDSASTEEASGATPSQTPPPPTGIGQPLAGGAGAPSPGQQNTPSITGRLSLNGGVAARVPSYSAVGPSIMLGMGMANASISPSPLGLSCSNAVDLLEEELGEGRSGSKETHAVLTVARASLGSHRPPRGDQPLAPAPFLVPSPSLSPQTSRRTLIQEPSFNQRLSRHDSGHQRPPSRLSLTDSNTSGPAASAPGRAALLVRGASNRTRALADSAEEASGQQPGGSSGSAAAAAGAAGDGRGPLDSSGGGSSSRRIVSAKGPYGSLGSVLGSVLQNFSQPQLSLPKGEAGKGGAAGGDAHPKEDDLLFLSPMESRRLSVTAGGASSFRRLGGAGIIVGASPPSGPPGAVSPAISRVQSTDYSSGRPGSAGGIPPAIEEAIADGTGADSCKAPSNDSIISNADISMQTTGNRGGWRRERPAPLQVGTGAGVLPGGVVDAVLPETVDTPGCESARPIPQAPSMRRLRGTMRRSATHSNILQRASSGMASGGGGGAVITSGGGPPEGPDAVRFQKEDEEEGRGEGADTRRATQQGRAAVRHAVTDMDRVRQDGSGQYYGPHSYASASPLVHLSSPGDRVRMRRHSTSSYNAGYMLTRILGVSTGGGPLDRSSIQEWSTTSKLAQKAIQRSDSMHSRMAQMVLRAKQHAVRRKRRGSMQLITTRGPGSVVGELCIDGKPTPSPSTVVAKGPVTVLLIKSEKVNKYRNQPSVMAALHRTQNASLVQEAMERFVECEQEVVAVEVIRRTITTEPNLHLEVAEEYTGEHQSSERLMADIYNG